MARPLIIGAAQLGPIGRSESRQSVVKRMLELMHQAASMGCQLIVYPELALTSFFPRWYMEDQEELDSYFEREMPSPETRPLFDEARKLGMGFYLGYAELEYDNGNKHRYNTAILVDGSGKLVGKYRKIHLPGHADHRPQYPFQHLEKRYFEVGNLGFGAWRSFGGIVGMCICNDRRWPETYRVMALQGAELIVLGYNTPSHVPWAPEYDHFSSFHNHLVMQSAAYQNGTWVVGVAKAGVEEGCDLIGGSCIIAPSGQISSLAATCGDELVVTRADLDYTRFNKQGLFDFAKNREPEHYKLITERRGAVPPD